jgi:hypothetical protein
LLLRRVVAEPAGEDPPPPHHEEWGSRVADLYQSPLIRTEARSDSVSGEQTKRVFVDQLCLPSMAQESKDVEGVELFVRNLAYDTTKQDLVDTFQDHGTTTNMHASTH